MFAVEIEICLFSSKTVEGLELGKSQLTKLTSIVLIFGVSGIIYALP